jgi:hypothetical protein
MSKPVRILAAVSVLGALATLFVGLASLFPRRWLPTAEEMLAREGFSWRTHETPTFLFHYEADSHAEKELETLAKLHDEARRRVLDLLGERRYPPRVHVFAVETRERMRQMLGWETNGQAIPDGNALCVVFSKLTNAAGAHELMHVVSQNLWGALSPTRNWLNEGLAVYSDDVYGWGGYELHALSKHMRQTGQSVPLAALMTDFDKQPQQLSYPATGSFVKFLYQRYGRDKLKQLWQAELDDLPAIYGKGAAELEMEWHAVIEQADARGIEYQIDR